MPNNNVHIGCNMLNVEEVYRAVAGLENIDKDRAIKMGLRRAGKDLIAGGRMRLAKYMISPKGSTGNLMSSFRLRVKRYKLGALVGFNQDYNAYKKGEVGYGSHAALVDRGTLMERFKKNGQSTGRMPSGKTSYRTGFWQETHDFDGAAAIKELMLGIEIAVSRIQSRR